MSDSDRDRQASSRSAYEGDEPPPWDIGRPQRVVVELSDEGVFHGDLLDVGCGTGENSILLASRGLAVIGIDPSPIAIERARGKAAARGVDVEFRVGDGLALGGLGKQFDCVLDTGVFHIFDDEKRPRYVDSIASATKPGGLYVTVVFSDAEPPGWGPRRVREDELRTAFADGWKVESIEPSIYEIRIGALEARAWCARIRRQ